MEPDTRLMELAESQHAFVRRADARAVYTTKALTHRVKRGDWEVHGPRVLRRRGAPWTRGAPLMRAVLDAGPGSFVSHMTAAAWWGLPGFDLLRIHVTRPRNISGIRPTFAQVLHEVVDLTPEQVTTLDGIPIVRPERLAFELFACSHPLRAARATETAWAKGLLSGASLRVIFEQLAGRGRDGTVATRAFLENHPVDWVPPASGIESRFRAIAESNGLGRWRRQIDLGADGWVGRVDFLREDLPLVVEVQSERYHAALLDRAADARRRAALERAGFVVVEVWDTQVWHDRGAVVAAVQTGVRAARAMVPAA